MANIECRAELHGDPTADQYKQFHDGMQEFGLVRKLCREGKVFLLPTGFYVGENVSSSLQLLSLKITALAFRITGSVCKLTLTPIGDLSSICISGLEEDKSFESLLGFAAIFGSSVPTPGVNFMSAFSGLGAQSTSQHVPSVPPLSSWFGKS
ncbi:MAG: hypothetical protein WAK26_11560 [Terracidiphilus sp.]